MFYYVLFVLSVTALALGYFVFKGIDVKLINRIGYETTRRGFVLFGVIFMIISMLVSRMTNESLAFSFFGVYFADEYSTLVWAIVYFLILYVSIFEEFHLNGWIVSKSKAWNKIDDAQLNHINQLVIKDVLDGTLGEEEIFYRAISNLMILQEDSVRLGLTAADIFNKEFRGIYYYCKDERIDMFVDGIVNIINLMTD